MAKKILIFLLLFAVLLAAIVLIASTLFSVTPPAEAETTESVLEFFPVSAQEEATPEPTPEETPMPEDPQPPERTPAPEESSDTPEAGSPEAILSAMTLEEKLCQMLFVTPEALTGGGTVTTSDKTMMEAISRWPVGGVIYFGDNLVSTEQVTAMITSIQAFSQEASGIGLFIGVDEEGGTVARAGDNLGTTQYEDMAVYGAQGDSQKAYEIGQTLAGDLMPLGFNVDFAPVADVLTNEENTVVSRRSFGSDPELVSDMVSQLVKGLTDGGMLACPKHFPGHGSTGGDTHDGFAATAVTEAELYSTHLKPFIAAMETGTPMIMVGHMTLTEIDSEYPATLSETIVTRILREELGYDGIIITDAMNMGAIANNYLPGEAAVMAVAAGCDMLLCVSDIEAAVTALTQAVESGQIPLAQIDASVLRILNAKAEYGILS